MENFETREDPPDDGLNQVTAAVGELRAGAAAFETRIGEQLAALTARLDEREVRAQRPGVGATAAADPEETRAFTNYLRTGNVAQLDTRALETGNAGAGGVLVPAEMSSTIIARAVQFSPIRSLATILPMGTGNAQLPRLNDEVTVGPDGVPETGDRPSSEPSFQFLELSANEIAVKIPISRVLLEDAAVDLTSFLSAHVGMKFGQRESAWFLTADGTRSTTIGILNDLSVTAITAAATTIGGDDVIDLYHSIPSAYAQQGAFLANRKTMAALRKLKDTAGQYLLQPSLAAGTPPTLHGRPLYEAPELDDPTTGLTPLLFGDFASGYVIGERVAFTVQRDDFTGADQGVVYLRFRRRVGGIVTLGEAISKLKLR